MSRLEPENNAHLVIDCPASLPKVVSSPPAVRFPARMFPTFLKVKKGVTDLKYPRPAFFVVLALFIGLTYWRCVTVSFFQDDWGWLYNFSTNNAYDVIRSILSFKGKLFYRPLCQLYMFGMYRLFGENPVPFHIVALSIHFANSVVVALIIRKVTKNDKLAYFSSLFYAVSLSVNLDPLLWMVGSYDLLCAFFFFLSLVFYLHRKFLLSIIAFACSILSKESSFMLPVILLSYQLICRRNFRDGESVLPGNRGTVVACSFATIMALSLLPKLVSRIFYFNFPSTHPYVVKFFGAHVLVNLYAYPAWMLRTFLPFFTIRDHAFQAFVVMVGLCVLWGLKRMFFVKRDTIAAANVSFLFLWVFFALLPVMLLANHRYAYYSVYALPAFVALILCVFENAAKVKIPGKFNGITAFVIIIVAVAAMYQSNEIFRYKLDDCVRHAAIVDEVRRDLMRYLARPPKGAVLVFDGVETDLFANENGPRCWYRDSSIDVYELTQIRFDGKDIYSLDTMNESDKVTLLSGQYRKRYIEPAKVYIFKFMEDGLIQVDIRNVFPNLAHNF